MYNKITERKYIYIYVKQVWSRSCIYLLSLIIMTTDQRGLYERWVGIYSYGNNNIYRHLVYIVIYVIGIYRKMGYKEWAVEAYMWLYSIYMQYGGVSTIVYIAYNV